MTLGEILSPSCVKVSLEGGDKISVIGELVDLLDSAGALSDRESVFEAVMLRERAGSTGIGGGIAIPHCKCNAVEKLVMAIGIIRNGIEFESIDEKVAKIIILLISSLYKTNQHVEALSRVSRLMLDNEFKEKLEQSESSEQAYELLIAKDAE